MTYIRAAIAWVLFVLGVAAFRLTSVVDSYWLYRTYQRCMLWSSDVQDGDCGPWERV